QIELSRELKLPIVVHVREADEEMMSLLNEYSFPYSGIIHCFSSDMKFADFALSKNFLLSFAGPITYKKNVELREVLKHVPLESLLLETDSPFLAPQDKRGKPNTPLYISSIYEKAAEVKEVEVNTIIEHINKNFFKLLKKN
ncbi:MAG: TatD family deoxyribonuclease, partial [Spirochaetia bacterium]|nr:TatD family deoxyribonuclease [Spirochaetia bacterium]